MSYLLSYDIEIMHLVGKNIIQDKQKQAYVFACSLFFFLENTLVLVSSYFISNVALTVTMISLSIFEVSY